MTTNGQQTYTSMDHRGSEEPVVPPFAQVINGAAREYLKRVLDAAGGNVSRAARVAGVHRSQMYRMLGRYGVQHPVRPASRGNAVWQALGS
jgi:transcriptional regulator of acetoin/glycerol metabolism